eukprot:1158094-Pelagomonas_calceolata.AAC.4
MGNVQLCRIGLLMQNMQESQRGLSEYVPKYAPFWHLKCAHPQPLHLIGRIFAPKCGWRYKLPEHMLRFV